MSDQTFRLTELRSLIIPIGQFLAWPLFFVLSFAISLQPAYFLALALVLAADIFDSSPKNSNLIRDSLAGFTTAIIAVLLNDSYGPVLGGIVAVVAALRVYQKLK